MRYFLAFALVILGAGLVCSQPDEVTLLPTGWRIHPAGTQIPLDTLPMSSAISPDGKFLLVLNGGLKPPSISVLSVSPMREIQRVPVADAWLGLTFAPNGKQVYVGGGSRSRVFEFSFSPQGELKPSREFEMTPAGFVGDVTISPDGRLVYAADLFADSVVVFNPQSGRMIERYKTGRRPYRILFHPTGKSFFVSSWADGAVYLHDAVNGSEIGRIRLGPHTTDLALSNRKLPEVEDPPPYRLFVAAANTNNVFVVSVNDANTMKIIETINVGFTSLQPLGMTPSALSLSPDQTRLFVACSDANAIAVTDISEERSRVNGFLPTGWYPTATRPLADGRLIVLNGRSDSMSVIDPLTDETIEDYDKTARGLVPPLDTSQVKSPIEHVIYIVGGSAGYNQPNYAKLAHEFVRFDNFHVNSEIAAEAHNWAIAGIAPDFTAKLAPNHAAGRRQKYDFEGGEPANTPPAGYLWNNALSAGLTVRNYGYFDGVRDPALRPITNMNFQGSDAERARVFLDDLRQFESTGMMPRLLILRLSDDASDTDRALGMIVEGVSKSRFWPKTAIFVMPVKGGADHRSALLALSPFTRRGIADNAPYNSSSVLRTIEFILGLRPMTLFDASAPPLSTAFATTPNDTPYTAP